MDDQDDTKHQPIDELEMLLRRVKELEATADEHTRTEEAYRSLAENSLQGLAINQDGRVVYANRAFEKITGYSRQEMYMAAPEEVMAVIHPDDRGRVMKNILDRMQGHPVEPSTEYRIVHKDGSIRWVKNYASLSTYHDRPSIQVTYFDITDYKRAEEQLEKSEALLAAAISQSPSGILIADAPNVHIRYANPAALGIRGPTTAPLTQIEVEEHTKNWQIFLPDGVTPFPPHELPLSRAILEGVVSQNVEGIIYDANGQRRWISANASPVWDREGKITSGILICHEITDRKQSQDLFQARTNLLEFAATHSLDELLQKTLDEVCALVNSPLGFYHFVNADQRSLSSHAWSSRTVEEFCTVEGKKLHYPIDQAGVWVDCVRERRPVIHNNYGSLPHRKGMPEGHAAVVRELVVPIMREDKIVAILGVGNKPDDYTEKDITLVSYLADVVWEIAQRKQTEQDLIESENLMRSIFRAAPVGIGLVIDRVLIRVNEQICKMIGYTAEELIGQSARILYPSEEEFEYVGREKYAQLSDQAVGTVETRWRHKDGEVIDVLLSSSPLDPSDYSIGVTFTALDITQRKRTIREIQQSEEKFRALTEHSIDMIMRFDREHRYLYVNPIVENQTAIKPETFLGQTHEELGFPEHLCALWRGAIDQVFNTAEPHRIEFALPNGIWFDWLLTPEFSPKGQVAAVITSARDITERKRSEKEKGRLEDQLRQAQKMEAVGRLAGGVAHDFNNILTGIIGYTELIQSSLSTSDPLCAHMEEIHKGADRAAGLTAQLLAFSRKQIIEPKVIQPNEIVRNSQKMLRRIIGEDINLNFEEAKDLWRIMADPGQLDQILVNLVINARDAMPDGGKLTIETQNVTFAEEDCSSYPGLKPGDHILLAVSDSGHGMDAEVLQHVFEPFFSTKAKGHGTGLGLSTVYGIVKQNNGYIKISSVPNKGTIFSIFFPAVKTKAEEIFPRSAASHPTGRETILLVEDDDFVRRLAKKTLEMYGYKVIEHDSGVNALRFAEKLSPPIDLLLTDIVMPGMNGKELHTKLLQILPGLKTLFMSGYTEDTIAHHGILDEDITFLQKPFTVESLTQKVREVIDR